MSGILMPYLAMLGQMSYVPPNQIPNLSLWYNASASSTDVNGTPTQNFNVPVSNGTAINKWFDLSGGGHASSTFGGSGNEPNYATPVQNGLGALLYTAANSENLDINPIAWMASLSGFTIYVLARPTSLPATQFPLTVTDTSTGVWWNGTNWSVGVTAGNRGTATVTNDTSKFHIYGMVYDGTQTGNANRLQLRYDKTNPALTFTGTIPATTGSPSYFFFGGDDRSGGSGGALSKTYMNGYIGEVLIWTRKLTSTELINVEGYLNQKWNLGL